MLVAFCHTICRKNQFQCRNKRRSGSQKILLTLYASTWVWKGATLRPGNTPSHSEYCSSPTGSSAGAGSEVYHVYRHLRRRETVRQQWIQEEAEKEEKEREFQEKLAANKAAAEERTAKKRAKRSVLNFLRKATTKH